MIRRQAARFTMMGTLLLLWVVNAAAVDNSQVLATVGEESIIVQEFINLAPAMPLLGRQGDAEAGKKRLLDNIIRHHLFAQEAVRLGLDQDPVVKANLQFLIANTLSRAYTKHLFETITINDEQAKRYFETHTDDFAGKEFSDVNDEIKLLLKNEAIRDLIDEKATTLSARENVTVNEVLLEKIALPAASQ